MLSSRNTGAHQPFALLPCHPRWHSNNSRNLAGHFKRVGRSRFRAVSLPQWGPLPLPARAAMGAPCPLPPAPLPFPEGGAFLGFAGRCFRCFIVQGGEGSVSPLPPPSRPAVAVRPRSDPHGFAMGSARDRASPSRRAVPPLPRSRSGCPPTASPPGVSLRPRASPGESGIFYKISMKS